MPVAIPAIVGWAASSAAAAGAFSALGAWAATSIGSAIIGFGASQLTGFATRSMNKPQAPSLSSQLTQVGAARTVQVRQPVTPHQYHYGQVKTSGPILLIHSQADSFDRAFGNMYLVHGLSGTKIKAIRTVYFGDELASLAKFQAAESQIRIGKHLGELDQAADADFVAEIGSPKWGANHRLRGRAYIATRLTWHAEHLSQIENIAAIVDGIDTIYDPRTGLTGFHNNAALCIANWLTSPYGENRAWSKIHEPTLIESANICDERVLLLPTTTTATVDDNALTLATGGRFLDWGDGVRFTSSGTLPTGLAAGTTYYAVPWNDGTVRLASSVANAFAGTSISVAEDGTGTLTMAYYDEARYKCNGTFTADMEKGEVLDQLRGCMAGYAFPRGGQWYVHAGAAALPAVSITDNDLRAHPQVSPKRSVRDRFNGVRGVYVNPDANWQPTDAPPRLDQTYLSEDDNEELVNTVSSNFITSERQMQRVMKVELERNRRELEVDVPCKLTAFKLAPLDGFWLTLDGYFSEQQSLVTGWALTEDLGVNIKAKIDDAAIYDWSVEDELVGTSVQGLVLPNSSDISAPAEVTVLTPKVLTFTFLRIEWPEVKNIFIENGGGYDVEFRPRNPITPQPWNSFGRISADLRAEIPRTTTTDFRVRAVTRNGATSEWTENLAPGPPTDVAASVDPDPPGLGIITWVNDPDCVTIQLFKDGVMHNDVVPGPDESIGDLNDGSYQLRSVNADGNISMLSAAVVVSGVGGGSGGGDDGAGDGSGGDDDDDDC